MQTLDLSVVEFKELKQKKVMTIRLGRRNIQLGDLTFVNIENSSEQIVNVTHVQYCALYMLPLLDVGRLGFENILQLQDHLNQYYPTINLTDEITLIKFNYFNVYL